jgi:hypothetical protein
MVKKAVKSIRGVGESYDEVKERYSFCLTPTAKANLEKFSQENNISQSELIEKIGRHIHILPLLLLLIENQSNHHYLSFVRSYSDI